MAVVRVTCENGGRAEDFKDSGAAALWISVDHGCHGVHQVQQVSDQQLENELAAQIERLHAMQSCGLL